MPQTEAMTGCPLRTAKAASPHAWWPNQLNLKPLSQYVEKMTENYAEEFKTLDLDELKRDLFQVMTTSQDWWPADYGHYGPFFIRMAWHSAGTYRTFDGRGGGGRGNLRFAPLNSWPDNGNLDKARRLLWPIKQKYGRKISWGDLMIFAGNCALENMGLKPFGFGGGRVDFSGPEEDIYWGPENKWLAAERGGIGNRLHNPLGAVQMGLIYVNPEGPLGNPDPLEAAKDIRETFSRMAMTDEETVALIAGGHTFGKAHGAADPSKHVGPEPEGASMQEQGLGWMSSYRSGKGGDAITSGLEGAWTSEPTRWDTGYFENLFGYEWEQTKSPGGATQWVPTRTSAHARVRDAHDACKAQAPVIMFTTDLALRFDAGYAPIARRFLQRPELFADAFARAWFKLTHRDMGPRARYLGPLVPPPQLWQDPVPAPDASTLIGPMETARLKARVLLDSGLTGRQLVAAAWAAAATFRGTDRRGGANGARLRLAPQKHWPANAPPQLSEVLRALQDMQARFNLQHAPRCCISLADLLVLAGCAAVEAAAQAAGHSCAVPFAPGRTDASAADTDAASFAVLEPAADGFRNYLSAAAQASGASPEALLVEKAHMLTLNTAEMTVLVAGMRVLDANSGHSQLGVLTTRPGTLSNDFLRNLLDNNTVWKPCDASELEFEGRDRASGRLLWRASRVDLLFGSNSQLRGIAEHYASADANEAFVNDFVAAWAKVMHLDRFDLPPSLSESLMQPRSKL